MRNIMEMLANYNKLIEKVDRLCEEISRDFAGEINCVKGCDGCCLHFSVFWVEAVNLARAVENLPREEAAFVRSKALSIAGLETCPLLHEGECLLYPHRPIICRTHGLPILTSQSGSAMIDFCPRNFQHAASIPGNAVIHLDRLNETLAAVNTLFVHQYFHGTPPPTERVTIADALFLKF
jgi:uncharacterized protein